MPGLLTVVPLAIVMGRRPQPDQTLERIAADGVGAGVAEGWTDSMPCWASARSAYVRNCGNRRAKATGWPACAADLLTLADASAIGAADPDSAVATTARTQVSSSSRTVGNPTFVSRTPTICRSAARNASRTQTRTWPDGPVMSIEAHVSDCGIPTLLGLVGSSAYHLATS